MACKPLLSWFLPLSRGPPCEEIASGEERKLVSWKQQMEIHCMLSY